ncbi:MAG: hypothetical protein PHD04_00080 [Candidatus Pacebacteria bacterium]|nr:hypothetical protein [Candidatus Paceibacterota bacterium]
MEKNEGTRKSNSYESDSEGFVCFPDVAIGELRQQAQYASRYVDGVIEGYPNLGEGLRFKGDTDDYHSLRIHKDDIREFVERVLVYKKSTGNPFA